MKKTRLSWFVAALGLLNALLITPAQGLAQAISADAAAARRRSGGGWGSRGA